MRRVVLVCLATALLATTPAVAIVFGQPDGDRHPYVGAMFVKLGDGTLIPWCTGAMVSKRVFLTAGHCTYDAEAIHGSAGYELGVTFVPDLGFDDPVPTFDERDLVMGVGYTHPAFVPNKDAADRRHVDVGVVVLERDPRVGRADLPSEGLLDSIDLKSAAFTTVGYGVARDTKTGGQNSLYDDGLRRYATQTASHLNPSWLKLSMNPSAGNGGTCYGDSGGPHLLGSGQAETRTVVSVTSRGDAYCRSTDWTARVDTAAALSFITSFIDN
jgi:hypothetical protein